MDIKDITTPLATIIAVWLAAGFALRNERMKKALELRTKQIDQLADLVNRSCTNLINHTGAIANVIEIRVKILNEATSPSIAIAPTISIETIHAWLEGFENKETWGLDNELYRQCAHGLEFHRENEWLLWKKVAARTLVLKDEFLMMSMPGKSIVDMKDRSRSSDEISAFTILMRKQIREIENMRVDIMANLRNEYLQLTKPQTHSLRFLLKQSLQRVQDFFR